MKKVYKNTGLSQQIESAQRSMEKWPDWMKKGARYEGSEEANYSYGDSCNECQVKKKMIIKH